MARIAPSLIAADFARLGDALAIVKAAGVRTLHLDVMDGHFAPDITMGQPVVESLRRGTDLELEVHLAIERPERFIEDFARAGADRIAVHVEATPDLHRAVQLIRGLGRKAGLALNPATPLASASEILEGLDFLLILTADLAIDEGEFIQGMSNKIARAAKDREEKGLKFEIEAEGGIAPGMEGELISAGADILVAGSAIFRDGDLKSSLERMLRAAAQASPALDSSYQAQVRRP